MNKPTRIPPPPKGCYKSCQYDQRIAEKIGKYLVFASIALGISVGLAAGVGMGITTIEMLDQLK